MYTASRTHTHTHKNKMSVSGVKCPCAVGDGCYEEYVWYYILRDMRAPSLNEK